MPDSTTNDDRYMITRVKALYPRINQTYKFDSSAGKKGQSVPCDALDDGAKYELSFLLDESAAKELYAPMAKLISPLPNEITPGMKLYHFLLKKK